MEPMERNLESRDSRSDVDKISLSGIIDNFVKVHDSELYQPGSDFKRVSDPPYEVRNTDEGGKLMLGASV
jgi:hypothetical protein